MVAVVAPAVPLIVTSLAVKSVTGLLNTAVKLIGERCRRIGLSCRLIDRHRQVGEVGGIEGEQHARGNIVAVRVAHLIRLHGERVLDEVASRSTPRPAR